MKIYIRNDKLCLYITTTTNEYICIHNPFETTKGKFIYYKNKIDESDVTKL